MSSFFRKPYVRATVIAVLTIAVGVLSSILANNLKSVIWWIVFAVVGFGELFVLFLYSRSDENVEKQYSELVDDYETLYDENLQYHYKVQDYEIAMQNISDLCRDCSTQTNIEIHSIYDSPEPTKHKLRWDFDYASSMICKSAYDGVIKSSRVRLDDTDAIAPDVELSYVKLIENNKSDEGQDENLDNQRISLCGFYHPQKNGTHSQSRPKKVGEIKDSKHYAKLFSDDIASPEFLSTEDELKAAFGEKHQYCQYIAIPVRCTAISKQSKLVGIFQIASLNGYHISPRKEDVDYLISHFFTPFSYLFLFTYKLEKAMLAAPRKGGPKNESKEQG